MTNTPTARLQYSGPILFERGYRPFFLGAALFAGIAIPLWIAAFKAGMEIPSAFSVRDYHVHEMIFGYLSAVLAGFLFTAMPNWTGRPPVAGIVLAFLSGLWLAGRLAIITSALWPTAAAVIDASFLLTVCTLAWRDILLGGSIRNIPVCLIVSMLTAANILYHLAQLEGVDTAWIERSSLSIIIILISLVGERVVPNFSSSWMKNKNIFPLPASFSRVDTIVLVATVIALGGWIVTPGLDITGYLLTAVFFLHMIRLFRWRGWQTTAEPLVLILHIGYLWLTLWFGLTGLVILQPELFSASSALHALTAGAIGTMTMAIMTRAILGHSGRQLTAGPATQLIYALIVLGSILRVFSETISENLELDYTMAISIGGAFWATGFILFAIIYGPYCLSGKEES